MFQIMKQKQILDFLKKINIRYDKNDQKNDFFLINNSLNINYKFVN